MQLFKRLVLLFSIVAVTKAHGGSYSDPDYPAYDPFRDQFLDMKFHPAPPNNQGKKIPKIIHQFWIGDKPLPDPYKKLIETCKNLKGFEHKFWTNENVDSLFTKPEYREAFASIPAHDHPVRKDYLLYLALEHYGGVVLDASIGCLQEPTRLHEEYSYYFAYPFKAKMPFKMDAAYFIPVFIVASIKNGPIIQQVLDRFPDFIKNYAEYNKKYTASYFTDKHLYHGWMGQVLVNEAIRDHCIAENNGCSDVRLLGKELFSFASDQINSLSEAIYVNMNPVPMRYTMQALYEKSVTLKEALEATTTFRPSYNFCSDATE